MCWSLFELCYFVNLASVEGGVFLTDHDHSRQLHLQQWFMAVTLVAVGMCGTSFVTVETLFGSVLMLAFLTRRRSKAAWFESCPS